MADVQRCNPKRASGLWVVAIAVLVFFSTGASADIRHQMQSVPSISRAEPVQAVEGVVSAEFKDDLFRFYRKIFEAETAALSDDELRGRIEHAVVDTRRLGASREDDILRMSALRVLAPAFAADPWYWDAVMNDESNNVLMRSGLFLAYYKFNMSAGTRAEFEGRLGVFGLSGIY